MPTGILWNTIDLHLLPPPRETGFDQIRDFQATSTPATPGAMGEMNYFLHVPEKQQQASQVAATSLVTGHYSSRRELP